MSGKLDDTEIKQFYLQVHAASSKLNFSIQIVFKIIMINLAFILFIFQCF